jgi:hypothetical protein
MNAARCDTRRTAFALSARDHFDTDQEHGNAWFFLANSGSIHYLHTVLRGAIAAEPHPAGLADAGRDWRAKV